MRNQNQVITNHIMEKTLTEIEALGLASKYDLANGHASHELSPSQQAIINQLPAMWERSARQKSRDAELMYKHAFQKLANTPSLLNYEHFKICPTASNSIDMVAAWLGEKKFKTALIEPTFDNLYLILKRRKVELTSLPEELLHNGNFRETLKAVDAVFLVNPNNPTGKVISQALFSEIIEWCAANSKVLIIDNSFRFFTPQTFDMYQLLLDARLTFISFEDTGKVWPAQEIKASLIFSSANIFNEIDLIYDEIFLCHSNFSLNLLTAFLDDAYKRGLFESVWKQVASRRKRFRAAVDNNILSINTDSLTSTLSVEWAEISDHFASDSQCAEHFSANNLILLPGRQFYWAHQGREARTEFVRFALLKPEHDFSTAIDFLSQELKRLAHA